MLKQTDISGKTVTVTKKNEFFLKDKCCKACYHAKGKQCKCKCNGQYHGLGRIKNKNIGKTVKNPIIKNKPEYKPNRN